MCGCIQAFEKTLFLGGEMQNWKKVNSELIVGQCLYKENSINVNTSVSFCNQYVTL